MRIVIIDDDKLVALSLKTILESTGKVEILAIGNSGEEAIELYREYRPEVMLMDIRMNGMSGLEAGEKILSTDSEAKILYLTTFSDDDYEGIAPALEAAVRGQSVFGKKVIDRIPALLGTGKDFDYARYGLSEKEAELIELIAQGMNNKEISAEIYLSEGTVRNYISELLEKLELRDRTQLAVYYYTHRG